MSSLVYYRLGRCRQFERLASLAKRKSFTHPERICLAACAVVSADCVNGLRVLFLVAIPAGHRPVADYYDYNRL